MKRANVFLTITTCILAVAGIAATKMGRDAIVGFYYLTGGQCLENLYGILCTSFDGPYCLYTAPYRGSSTVYEYRLGTTCYKPIYRDDD